MKIDNSHLNPADFKKAANLQPVDRSGQSAAIGKSEDRDRAELSEQARLLSQARTALDNLPSDEQRDERLNQLREQIEAGTYHVPVKDLARRLLAHIMGKHTGQE